MRAAWSHRTGSRRRGAARALACALALGVLVPGALAESRVPASRNEIALSFSPLVKSAAPAVVNIYATRLVKRAGTLFDDPFFRRFFGNALPFSGRPRTRVHNSLGSGVIVRPDGLIVTNHHVVRGADEIRVVLADRREFKAEVAVRDERTDLAVLRIDADRLPHLGLRDSDTLEVGDLVLAIGNPFGVGQTVTSGIVSALARSAASVSDYSFFIQTDAAINPGNSGGALVTGDGRLAGINTAIYTRTGASNGIGFAIPSNMVATVIAAADRGGRIVRPWLGARVQGIDAELARGIGLSRAGGAMIAKLHEGGAAAGAGLRVGDVVLSIDGREVADDHALRFRIGTLGVGKAARLELWRRGDRRTVSVPLLAPPEDPPRDATRIGGRNPFAGARVANLSPALALELSRDPFETGVVVLDVGRASAAGWIELKPGDVVVAVNGARIRDVGHLAEAVGHRAGEWRLTLRRDGRMLTLVVGG